MIEVRSLQKKVLFILLLGFSLLSLFVGVKSVPITSLIHLTPEQSLVLWTTRIPRTLSLLIAGATIAVNGLIMQQLTQNKFVSPTTAGTMDSAKLGILIAMLFFHDSSILVRSGIAFVFSLLGTFVFLRLIQKLPQYNQLMIPLIGLMYGNVIGAVVTFFAYQFQLIQNMSSWLQGNFATVTKGSFELMYLAFPLLIVVQLYAQHFTLAGLGKDTATAVGLNYQKTQWLGLTIVAMSSSIVLVTVGTLPFLGVVVPNIVSLFYGDYLKETVSITAICGSLFLVVSDILARLVIAPYEVPVSLIVSVIGSLLFIGLLIRGYRNE